MMKENYKYIEKIRKKLKNKLKKEKKTKEEN